jgi:hypothetical protein
MRRWRNWAGSERPHSKDGRLAEPLGLRPAATRPSPAPVILSVAKDPRAARTSWRPGHPIGIAGLDEDDFPDSPPSLDLLFARDRVLQDGELLAVNKHNYAMLFAKPINDLGFVLPNPSPKIGRHANVERPVLPTGEDVNPGTMNSGHGEHPLLDSSQRSE